LFLNFCRSPITDYRSWILPFTVHPSPFTPVILNPQFVILNLTFSSSPPCRRPVR
jgi:hypothetical protein